MTDPSDLPRPKRPSHALERHGPVSVRTAVANDQRYLASTWWHSMLGRNRAPRLRHRVNEQIDRILDDATTRAIVAVDARDRILGWLVYATAPVGRVIHYAYVRDEERGHGLASRLVAAAWPGSEARLVLTCRGPMTAGYLERNKAALFVPLEEFIR